jgi:hypothetical protein
VKRAPEAALKLLVWKNAQKLAGSAPKHATKWF